MPRGLRFGDTETGVEAQISPRGQFRQTLKTVKAPNKPSAQSLEEQGLDEDLEEEALDESLEADAVEDLTQDTEEGPYKWFCLRCNAS